RLRDPPLGPGHSRHVDPRARPPSGPGAAVLPPHPSAAVLPSAVPLQARRLPRDRGGGRRVPRAALLRHDAARAGGHGVRCARRVARRLLSARGSPRRGKGIGMTALVLRTEAQQLLSRHPTAATVAGNLGLAFVAYLVAFLLRFDLAPSWRHWGILLSTLPLLF